MRPAIALTALDQPLDLAFGEVFPCSDLGVSVRNKLADVDVRLEDMSDADIIIFVSKPVR
jgi:hypothetical protein